MDQEETTPSFIEEIQSLNESTKKKVFVAAVIVTMVAVVYVWFGYFNGIVSTASQSQQSVADGASQQVAAAGNGSGNSDATNSNGLADIANGFAAVIRWIASIFEGPGQYNVQPTH